MSQNKKIWFFVEGHCEKNFIWMLIHRYFFNVKICKSSSEFLESDFDVCYIHNSECGERIPYDMVENMHFISRAGTEKSIIICDAETQLFCPVQKKEEMIRKAQKEALLTDQILDCGIFSFVISLPTIESIYCSEQKIVEEILNCDYKKRGSSSQAKEFDLEILNNETHKPQTRIKKLLERKGLYYDKRRFSEQFFGRLDFPNSDNSVVQRLYSLVQKIWVN